MSITSSIIDAAWAQNQKYAKQKAYKEQVGAYSNSFLQSLLPDYMAATGNTNVKKATAKLSKELNAEMGGIQNSGDQANWGLVDAYIPIPGGGFIDQADMETRKIHGQLYGAAALLYKKYSGAAVTKAPVVDYEAKTKAALDEILATVSSTGKASVTETDQAYLNRKDEIAKLRLRGISNYIGQQYMSPVTSDMSGTLDKKTLGGI